MASNSAQRVRLSKDPLGYWLGDEFRTGFLDDRRLPEGQRRRIAGWARALTPDALDDAQRALLAPLSRPPSEAQRRAEELGSYTNSPLWNHLSPSQQDRIRSAKYPAPVGKLAELIGVEPSRVRHWDKLGLLPTHRTRGGQRRFYPAAAVRGSVLATLERPEITVLQEIANHRAGALLASMAMVFHEQAARENETGEPEVFGRAADQLERVSVLMTGREARAA